MATKKVTPADRIAVSYQQLSEASSELHSAAKDLSDTISVLNAALQKLNLGVSAWHQIAGNDGDEDGNYWSRDIGYAKVGKAWGIAIRRTWGNNCSEETHNEETWLFADAPRYMCIEAAGKLPDLFDDLIKRTREATEKLHAKTAATREMIAAIAALAPEISRVPATKAK